MESAFLPKELTAKPCLSVKQKAAGTRFLCVLVPRKGDGPDIKAELLKAQGCTAVKATGQEGVDLFAVPDAPASFSCGDLKAEGAAALLRTKGGEVQFALLTRGVRLTSGDKVIVSSSRPANVSWRKVQGQVVVDAEAPYKTEGQAGTIEIGGLPPGRDFTVFIDGIPSKTATKSSAAGVVTVQVDLKARRTIQVGGDKSVVTIIPPLKAQ